MKPVKENTIFDWFWFRLLFRFALLWFIIMGFLLVLGWIEQTRAVAVYKCNNPTEVRRGKCDLAGWVKQEYGIDLNSEF